VGRLIGKDDMSLELGGSFNWERWSLVDHGLLVQSMSLGFGLFSFSFFLGEARTRREGR
jgi:hypothetical protein